MHNKLIRALVVLTVGAIIWFIPVPTGVKVEAWRLLAIFVATIVGFILQPLPIGALAFIALVAAALTKALTLPQVLTAFSDATTWLIVSAFLFARAFIKTGAGQRVSFVLIKHFGDSTLKLAYVLMISDMLIAPATPSNTARAGGMFYPIVRSLASSYKSEPGPTAKRMGSFLVPTVFQGDCIISGLFMTSMAGNPLMAKFVNDIAGINITWGTWLLGACVPVLLALAIVPLFIYWFEKPEITKTPEAKKMAIEELEKMGPMKASEKWLFMIFIVALILWATSQLNGLNATLVALMAVAAMLITGALEWNDITGEKGAWDTMFWMGGLICLAGFLNKLGLIPWFAKLVSASLIGISWQYALAIIVLVYIFSHYLFASLTAHIAAMFAALFAVAVAVGAPPYLAAFTMFAANSITQSLTHYSVGAAPIYFGAGYMSLPRWWTMGLMLAGINIVIQIFGGAIWWKILGFW